METFLALIYGICGSVLLIALLFILGEWFVKGFLYFVKDLWTKITEIT